MSLTYVTNVWKADLIFHLQKNAHNGFLGRLYFALLFSKWPSPCLTCENISHFVLNDKALKTLLNNTCFILASPKLAQQAFRSKAYLQSHSVSCSGRRLFWARSHSTCLLMFPRWWRVLNLPHLAVYSSRNILLFCMPVLICSHNCSH